VDTAPLWWPPAKISGRYLAPFLAQRLGIDGEAAPTDAVGVEVELDRLFPSPALYSGACRAASVEHRECKAGRPR
jgi:hypothetical protein